MRSTSLAERRTATLISLPRDSDLRTKRRAQALLGGASHCARRDAYRYCMAERTAVSGTAPAGAGQVCMVAGLHGDCWRGSKQAVSAPVERPQREVHGGGRARRGPRARGRRPQHQPLLGPEPAGHGSVIQAVVALAAGHDVQLVTAPRADCRQRLADCCKGGPLRGGLSAATSTRRGSPVQPLPTAFVYPMRCRSCARVAIGGHPPRAQRVGWRGQRLLQHVPAKGGPAAQLAPRGWCRGAGGGRSGAA